jgi:outer membrane protein OmpA-like peptidoglycan-associated protein
MKRVRSAAVARMLSCAVLALSGLASGDVLAATGTRTQRHEVDRAEALLRESLKPRPGTLDDPAIRLVREDPYLRLIFPVSIAFDPDSNSRLPDAIDSPPLTATVRLLKRHGWSAQLEVYTDSLGGAAVNQSLSTARATSLDDGLIAAGVHTDRVAASGAGNADPVGSNDTPEGRIQNRRVEIVFGRAANAARPPVSNVKP